MTEIELMKKYLLLKFEQADWHGVADAAMDLREMQAKSSDSPIRMEWKCTQCGLKENVLVSRLC